MAEFDRFLQDHLVRRLGRGRLARRALTVDTVFQLGFRKLLLRHTDSQQGSWLAQRFQDMGPTYVKLGQFISTRSDLFGKEFTRPFTLLRDRVTPMGQRDLSEIVEKNAGLKRYLVNLEQEPLASASIGQVHRGTLTRDRLDEDASTTDFTEVVVKFRRPNVDSCIREDVSFIRDVLHVLSIFRGGVGGKSSSSSSSGSIQVSMLEFENNILVEADYRLEVANMQKFFRMYRSNARIRVPRPVLSLCTEDAIVMEYVESTSLDSLAMLENRSAQDRRALARSIMSTFVTQLLTDGLVHGDPHPGNLGLDRKNAIVLYDFGTIIELSLTERQLMKELVYLLIFDNRKEVASTLKKLGAEIYDEASFKKFIVLYRKYMQTVDGAVLKELMLSMGPPARTTSAAGPDVPVKLPDKFVRLIRVFGMLEGTCKLLDQRFNYFELFSEQVDDLFFDDNFLSYKINADMKRLEDFLFPPRKNPV